LNNKCYLCGTESNKIVFLEHQIPIFSCSSCNHSFSGYEQEEHYDGYWDGSEQTFDLNWWDLAHREIYQEFINTYLTAEEGVVLDVGCGLGFFVKMVQDSKKNWKSIGYEMSERAVHFAKTKNNLSNVHSGLVQNSGIAKNSIDIITLWDVIEHITKPQPLIEYLYSIIKPGGFLFLQTPNFPIQLLKARLKKTLKGMKEGVHYLEAKDHVNDYTRDSLKKLVVDCGFSPPEFSILKPILSVSGSNSNLGKIGKMGFYYLTKGIWKGSFQNIFLNNTLFATCYKK
jgi:2-polyprenyl-3-methyl-5-hydroxy-6-metoxy-1,4-benzoquinol methylase